MHVPEDRIRKRAFEIYVARGAQEGHPEDDWTQAERELLGNARD
jgi:hypothetical protein